MTSVRRKEASPTPDLEEQQHYSRLLASGELQFDQEIKTLDVRALLGLIACLQQEMALEQRHFDQLNLQFQNRKSAVRSPVAEEEAVELSAALCRSQIRLAQLCNRNMRCFTQQAARAQQDRSGDLGKKILSPSDLNPREFESMTLGDNGHLEEDEGAEEVVRLWRREPSVEDILQSVRSLRQEKEPPLPPPPPAEYLKKLNGAKPSAAHHHDTWLNGDAKRQHPTASSAYNNNNNNYNHGNHNNNNENHHQNNNAKEENLVPTATQLLLKMKHSPPAAVEGEAADLRGKPKTRKSIFQQHMFQPREEHQSPFQGADDAPLEEEPLPPPPSFSGSDDSDVGGDYVRVATPPPFSDELVEDFYSSNGHPNGGGVSEAPVVKSDGHLLPEKLPASSHHQQQPKASAILNNNNVAARLEEEDAPLPSIIDQFGDEPEYKQRCRGTDVQWNVDDLLKELYELPQPKPPAAPPAAYINMEGYLEMLPIGRRQGTFWNAWKRRYFKLKDGYLFCYLHPKGDEAVLSFQLMGGRIDIVESQLLVDDGKGHCIMLRCTNRTDTERWRRALLTHTAENYLLTYAQPVVPYPQFFEKVLIVDIGSCSVRAGILCNQPTLPQVYFPTVCAEEKATGFRVYGKDALSPKLRLNSSVTFPLRPSAKITKFEVDMVAVKGILTKVFEDLNVDPCGYEVQLSLPRSFPFKSQTEVLDLLMTEFGVQGVNLMAQTVLALCSYNTTSGVVVDVGERLEVVPIVDGYVIESGVSRIPYGGSRLMDHLRHFLMQRHYGLNSITESFLLRHVLENSCYCALNYKAELQEFLSQPQNFEVNIPVAHFFPRDEVPWENISLDGGRFQAPEGLFRPEAWGLDNESIHKLVWKAIQECSVDVRKEMSRGIYLSGGVSMLPGFTERLQSEMEKLTPPSVQPKVHASPYRAHAAYLGACNWALSAGFNEAKISRDEWIANGSACLKKWHF